MELGQLKNPRVSLEAIEPQGKSELAQGLIDIFNDAKTKYFEDYQKTKKNPGEALNGYFKKQLQPKFTKLIGEQTGLKVEKVIVYENPTGNAAVLPKLSNELSTADAMGRYSGFGETPEWVQNTMNQEILSYEDFQKIAAALDKETGRIDHTVVKSMNLRVVLHMDVMTMVSLKDFVHPEAEDLTAEEAAAVWLHEIGHMISLVEKCAEQYFKFEAKYAMARSFVDNAPYGEQMKMLKDVAENEHLSKTSKGKVKQEAASRLVNSYNSVMGDGDRDQVEATKKPGETVKEAGRKGIQLAASLLMVIAHFLTISLHLVTMLGVHVLRPLMSMFNTPGLGWNDKFGDIAFVQEKSNTEVERRADEYVSMHGMGSYTASGLPKIMDAMTLAQFPMPSIAAQISNSEIYARVVHFYSLLLGLALGHDERVSEYESLVNRMTSLQQDAAAALRDDEQMSPDIVKHYITEYDRCREHIEKYLASRDKKTVKFINNMFRILEAVTDGQSLIDIVMDARFRKKYKEVADAVQNIQASPLFQKAAKLRMQEEGRM